MNKTHGDSRNILLFSSKEKTFFLYLSLGFAILLFSLYFLFTPLQRIGGTPYLVFYYTVQLLKLVYLFTAFGFMFVFARREGLKSGLCIYLYYLSFELLFQLCLLFSYIGEYEEAVIVINFFGTLLTEAIRILVLFLIPCLLFLRHARDECGVFPFSIASKLTCANIALFLLFFLIRTVEQIYETFVFIRDNCYGMPSLLTKNEILSIVFDFAFIPLSLALAYAVIYVTERKLLQKLEA